MYAIRIAFAFSFGVTALAQSGVMVEGRVGAGNQGVSFNTHVEPPSPGPWAQLFSAGFNSYMINSFVVAHRYLYDDAHHILLGYDLLIESQPQSDAFRASFLELGIGSLELPAIGDGKPRADAVGQWQKLPLAKYPAPRMIHVGDVISVELWTASDTGQKIIDEIHFDAMLPYAITCCAPPAIIQQTMQARAAALRAATAISARPAPTVPGPAREFSAEDAEMRLGQFRISVNGTPEPPATSRAVATGSLIWFSLPNRGRYVLSLTPHPALGFAKAGEVRGGVVTFTLDGVTIKLECPVAIAPGDAAYSVYVLHDPQWEPTAQAQRGESQYGSVAIGELAKLTQN